MGNRTPHALAAEVDRALKLDLSNGQFYVLAAIISSYPNHEEVARNLLGGGKQFVLSVIHYLSK